jgi:hypothetical protein
MTVSWRRRPIRAPGCDGLEQLLARTQGNSELFQIPVAAIGQHLEVDALLGEQRIVAALADFTQSVAYRFRHHSKPATGELPGANCPCGPDRCHIGATAG